VKHLLATLAIGFSTALAALGAATPAGAGGKPSYGCPPTFQGVSLDQYLNLPRVYAGLVAGALTRDSRISAFNSVDLNRDGVICAQDVATLNGSADGWQYFYNIVDDNASGPTG
jgi:hypothetical protein